MNADEIYSRLLAAFEQRDSRDSLRIAAKIILALTGEIKDTAAIERALAAAAEDTPPPPDFSSMQHYGYFRSSSDYRLRIALNLKSADIPYTQISLRENAQNGGEYRRCNSAGLVPAVVMDGETLSQSLAILEYLNELLPQPDLLPGDALSQARIRAFALAVACDIQPLCNFRVMQELQRRGADEAALTGWRHLWMAAGLAHLEERAARWHQGGKYLFAAQPTLAEICLIPQLYNARRFALDLSPYPLLCELEHNCLAHRAFRDAAPENHLPTTQQGESL